MKELKVKETINLIMEEKIEIEDLFFYIPEIGFVQINEIFFENGGVRVHNYQSDIEDYLDFNDKLFIENFKKSIDN